MRIGNDPIKVVMTKTCQASPNGIKIMAFFEGKKYTLTPQLAKAMIGAWKVDESEEIKPKVDEGKNKDKMTRTPGNKATAPRENK